MPSISCDSYQVLVPTETLFTSTVTTVAPLANTTTLVTSALILPHPDNTGIVRIGYGTSPQNQQALQLDFCGMSLRYNLADVRIQTDVIGDKVIILSTSNPF